MIEVLILSAALIGLGVFNWHLNNKLEEANNLVTEYEELLVQLATELQELGSPNVKVLNVKPSKEH